MPIYVFFTSLLDIPYYVGFALQHLMVSEKIPVKSGLHPVPWSLAFVSFPTGHYTGSWGTFGRISSPTDGYPETIISVTCIVQYCHPRQYGPLPRLPKDKPAHEEASSKDNLGWKTPVRRPQESWLGHANITCHKEVETGHTATWWIVKRDPRSLIPVLRRLCPSSTIDAGCWLTNTHVFT